MRGMHRATGQALSGKQHLKQSLQDLLTTPLGSRVMRPEYGSRLFELIDAPLNQATLAQMYAATAEAINRWEPRFTLKKVSINQAIAGKIELDLQGTYAPTGEVMTIERIVL